MQSQVDINPRESVNRLLDALGPNTVKTHLFEEADVELQGRRAADSSYQHYVVETQPGGQQEIYRLREYTEGDLSRIATRPTFRFRWKCKGLLEQANQVLAAPSESLEFEQGATLLWADIAALADYLGSTPEIDELISALHIAYAQHVKRVTPKSVVEALAFIFRSVDNYTKLPTKAVDEALDALEKVGVDLNFPMTFAKRDA